MRFMYFQPANITGQAANNAAKFNGLIYMMLILNSPYSFLRTSELKRNSVVAFFATTAADGETGYR